MQKPFTRIIHVLASAAWILLASNARSVTLEWTPSPEASQPGVLSHYKIYYSTIDFSPPSSIVPPVIPLSLIVPLENTSAVIPDLVPGLTYYFAIVAVAVDGTESEYSNVASFTLPKSDEQIDPTTEMNLVGLLPRLWLISTNGQSTIEVLGPVGASINIQSSLNPFIADSWQTVANVELITPLAAPSPSPQTILEQAFIPSQELLQDASAPDAPLRFYRLYMPLGYEIVAHQALASQDIYSRLIAVEVPGIGFNIVCYVSSEGAYLDYNEDTHVVKLESCGPTIREVADRVASRAGLNWTFASEFTVTKEGVKLLFATVFRNDDPLTDPPLGAPRASSSDVIIDF